jgi:hypothetical protein
MDKEKAAESAKRADALLKATNKGKAKPEDLAALHKCFDDCPDLWRAVNLAHSAAMIAINHVQATEGTRVVIRENYEGQQKALGYATASPLEKTLIEHAALCWLRLQLVEQSYSGVMAESHTLTLGDYWERRLSAAQRRYLRACETLARVRRLRLPALQVNIGQEQTNIAGTLAPGRGSAKAAP